MLANPVFSGPREAARLRPSFDRCFLDTPLGHTYGARRRVACNIAIWAGVVMSSEPRKPVEGQGVISPEEREAFRNRA